MSAANATGRAAEKVFNPFGVLPSFQLTAPFEGKAQLRLSRPSMLPSPAESPTAAPAAQPAESQAKVPAVPVQAAPAAKPAGETAAKPAETSGEGKTAAPLAAPRGEVPPPEIEGRVRADGAMDVLESRLSRLADAEGGLSGGQKEAFRRFLRKGGESLEKGTYDGLVQAHMYLLAAGEMLGTPGEKVLSDGQATLKNYGLAGAVSGFLALQAKVSGEAHNVNAAAAPAPEKTEGGKPSITPPPAAPAVVPGQEQQATDWATLNNPDSSSQDMAAAVSDSCRPWIPSWWTRSSRRRPPARAWPTW
jgi:hypothetical protein